MAELVSKRRTAHLRATEMDTCPSCGAADATTTSVLVLLTSHGPTPARSPLPPVSCLNGYCVPDDELGRLPPCRSNQLLLALDALMSNCCSLDGAARQAAQKDRCTTKLDHKKREHFVRVVAIPQVERSSAPACLVALPLLL